MTIVECAALLRQTFSNTVPAFETDSDSVRYLTLILKSHDTLMQAAESIKQVLTRRIHDSEEEKRLLEAEIAQLDLSNGENLPPTIFRAAKMLSTIAARTATAASANSILPHRPYGDEIIAQLSMIELELLALETQIADLEDQQKQKQDELERLRKVRTELDSLSNGKQLESALLHDQRQVSRVTELEQLILDNEARNAMLTNSLKSIGALSSNNDSGDLLIDGLAQGIVELFKAQQRIDSVLNSDDYRRVARVPRMRLQDLDVEIERIKTEINAIIAQRD